MQTLEKDCKNIIKIQEENYPETKIQQEELFLNSNIYTIGKTAECQITEGENICLIETKF